MYSTELTKLVYHNGVLNLLLTSIGNSSLERMETENHRIAANVIEIKQQISSSFRVPIATGDTAHIDKDMQLEISRIFLEKVEVERPWYSFGIDVWIQAGKWWLQKVSISLHHNFLQFGCLKSMCNLLKDFRHNSASKEDRSRAELIFKHTRTCSKHLGS